MNNIMNEPAPAGNETGALGDLRRGVAEIEAAEREALIVVRLDHGGDRARAMLCRDLTVAQGADLLAQLGAAVGQIYPGAASLVCLLGESIRDVELQRPGVTDAELNKDRSRLKDEHAEALSALQYRSKRRDIERAAVIIERLRDCAKRIPLEGTVPDDVIDRAVVSATEAARAEMPELAATDDIELATAATHLAKPRAANRAHVARVNAARRARGMSPLRGITLEEEARIMLPILARMGIFVEADSRYNEAEAMAEAIAEVRRARGEHFGVAAPKKARKSRRGLKNAKLASG